MKLLLTSVFLSFFTLGAFCQDWNLVEQNEQYSIYVAELDYNSQADGIHHQRLIFRYQNHTMSPIQISFNREVKYNGQYITQDRDFVVELSADSYVQYDESKAYDKLYYVFKKDHKGFITQSLEDFRITNLRMK
jgi:hypothetical protein